MLKSAAAHGGRDDATGWRRAVDSCNRRLPFRRKATDWSIEATKFHLSHLDQRSLSGYSCSRRDPSGCRIKM